MISYSLHVNKYFYSCSVLQRIASEIKLFLSFFWDYGSTVRPRCKRCRCKKRSFSDKSVREWCGFVSLGIRSTESLLTAYISMTAF